MAVLSYALRVFFDCIWSNLTQPVPDRRSRFPGNGDLVPIAVLTVTQQSFQLKQGQILNPDSQSLRAPMTVSSSFKIESESR